MKLYPVFIFAALLFFVNSVYAKGGCGHGCSHGGGYAAAHYSSDDDAFKDLRKKICTGYIVYGTDTLLGIIVCADNAVCIKTDPGQDSTYTYKIKDSNLTAIMLYENNQSLFMTKLNDNRLYRVFHTGKLSVYDTYFSFNYHSKEFFNQRSRVMYDSHTEKLKSFWTTSMKRKLVSDINKAYGLALKPKEYRKQTLLDYVSTLD